MTFAEFTRIYPLRANNIAWFFGAGTSVSAGMPSASDLVWEFKRIIYCAEERVSIDFFSNLSDLSIRNQIQSYFDSQGNCPQFNSSEEYSYYFERVFPSTKDRATYLKQQLSGMQNSFGHKVLGVLMKHKLVNLIFTTNFDKAFENAAIEELKVHDRVFVGTIDNAETTNDQFHAGTRPLIVKIHGDYFSQRLKNTEKELQTQDSILREVLYTTCLSNGLAVMGYSGRDASVMEIFYKALESATSFPNGIFWFTRSGSKPLAEVEQFIEAAKSKGIQAEFVEIDTFDTAWGEIIKQISGIPETDLSKLNHNYYRKSNSPVPTPGKNNPIIRFNAIEVTRFPSEARLVHCDIGNTKELIDWVKSKNGDVSVIRRKQGVVGFGSDLEFDRIFADLGMQKDVYHVATHELDRDDTAIKSLLNEVLAKALINGRPLLYRRKRDRHVILPHPREINNQVFLRLKDVLSRKYQSISGIIPQTAISWTIAIEITLQYKLGKSLLVINPTIYAGKSDDDNQKRLIAPFIKEATASWYNADYANILDCWIEIFFGGQQEILVSAFDENMVGFNATFKLKNKAPNSKAK